MTTEQRDRDLILSFIDWLYDECPVNPDEVPRVRLVRLWTAHLAGEHIPREQALPSPADTKVLTFRTR